MKEEIAENSDLKRLGLEEEDISVGELGEENDQCFEFSE